MLELEPSNDRAVEQIVNAPALKAECAMLLPALKQAALAPAGPQGVMKALAAQFAIFPQPERSEVEWAQFWAGYCDVLSELSVSAITAGLAAWLRNPQSQFLPKPGELLALAKTTENRAARAYERARKAAEYEPPKVYDKRDLPAFSLPRPPERSEADKANVRKWAREYIANVDAKDPEKQEPRANHGPTDERGLTPQMREIMDRRAEQ